MHTGWRKNGASLSNCKYYENFMTELRGKLVNFCSVNVLNARMQSLTFLFKNFIALWRHPAKTQLLCDAQIYLYSLNKRQ